MTSKNIKEMGNSEIFPESDVIIKSNQDPRMIWRHLTLNISYSPKNLKSHTQRILFCLDSNLSEYISGALYDLFVTLGDKGWDLRLRMFNLASPVMPYIDRAYFQLWLSENSDENLECHPFNGSVLKSKTCKEQTINSDHVDNSHQVSSDFSNSLEEVEYRIESGQLIRAQAILEEYCIENRNNADYQTELQKFYFYTKNKKSLDDFIIRLNDAGIKIKNKWLDLQAASNTW